jgi:hypothetical protein
MCGVIGTQGVLYHYVILMQTVKFNLMQTVKFNASFLICHIQCLPYARQRKDALIEENRHRRGARNRSNELLCGGNCPV